MKKVILTSIVMALCLNSAQAQIIVDQSGNIGLHTQQIPQSAISLNCMGNPNYDFYGLFQKNGMIVKRDGNATCSTTESYCGQFYNYDLSTRRAIGVMGCATTETGVSRPNGVSIGVFGVGGNVTPGRNFGVFGALAGTSKGAAIYGTVGVINVDENILDKRYAGYFTGPVMVDGTLYADQAVLTQSLMVPDAGVAEATNLLSSSGSDTSPLEKVTQIDAFMSARNTSTESAEMRADATCTESSLQSQFDSRSHYSLSATQIENVFPELIYTNDDGSKSINYVELVPILIESIKELNFEIQRLKNNTTDLGLASARTASLNSMELTSIDQNLSDKEGSAKRIKIYNLKGEFIQTIDNLSDSEKISATLSAHHLTAGIYICCLIDGGKIVDMQKVLVE